MKVLVCGGRRYSDVAKVNSALDSLPFDVSLIIEGGANGADRLARYWAVNRGVHVATVNALWDFHGRKAGAVRNAAMLSIEPDYCVAFPGGTGTSDMVRRCASRGITVWQPYATGDDV